MANTDIAIIGGGSFGVALASICKNNSLNARLWARNPAKVDANIPVSNNLQKVLQGAGLIIFAIPSNAFEEVTKLAKPYISADAFCISGAKGLEPKGLIRMSQVLTNYKIPTNRVGVLSGPNLATEIKNKKVTGTVVASCNDELVKMAQKFLATKYLRVYSSKDVIGVEWAGLLKNIYAILYGIVDQLDWGDNARGTLLSRSLAEMSRFGVAHGADITTFMGLAGVGDLVTTCFSPLSRNYQIGACIAKGKTVEEAVDIVEGTAEGINTVGVVLKLSRDKSISMPLASELYSVLFEQVTIKQAKENLMGRSQKSDTELPFGVPD